MPLADYFTFSRSERYGLGVLCSIMTIMLIIRILMPQFNRIEIFDTSKFAAEIEMFNATVGQSDVAINQDETITIDNYSSSIEYFFFNPNTATNDEFAMLGLNERQIRNIRNYMATGATFRRAEDLRRLYTISDPLYRQLEPYIRISSSNVRNISQTASSAISTTSVVVAETSEREASRSQEAELFVIELNTADSATLTQLSGIGAVLASRTVRYRNMLGGFDNVMQMSEVYGISEDLVERISHRVYVDNELIRKIRINTATAAALARHPYITGQDARAIVEYRQFQTRINGINELIQNNIIDDELAKKITPYLSFE
jgi:competence ComEA-like helix-hairpin-helix protein